MSRSFRETCKKNGETTCNVCLKRVFCAPAPDICISCLHPDPTVDLTTLSRVMVSMSTCEYQNIPLKLMKSSVAANPWPAAFLPHTDRYLTNCLYTDLEFGQRNVHTLDGKILRKTLLEIARRGLYVFPPGLDLPVSAGYFGELLWPRIGYFPALVTAAACSARILSLFIGHC